MKARIVALLILSVTPAGALPPPRAIPILTEAELRAAAADAPVARMDLLLPEKDMMAAEVLSQQFFNRPEERRYSDVTSADWKWKWQLFSDALVGKAKKLGFDSKCLELCLHALNRGRNRQTMWAPPMPSDEPYDIGTPKEVIAAREKEAQEKYQGALQDRELHPERWYNDSLAIVPVGAYLARHAKGECWIIVCRWEMISKGKPMPLGHTMVWAMDTRSASVVGYVTCDQATTEKRLTSRCSSMPTAVTAAASARVAPASGVADLNRSAKRINIRDDCVFPNRGSIL